MTSQNFENTQPDPKKDEGPDENDLSQANLPKGGVEMPEQAQGANPTDESSMRLPSLGTGLDEALLESLRAIQTRQSEALARGEKRPSLTEDEMDVVARATKIVRGLHEPDGGPPIDYDLVRKAARRELPEDDAKRVHRLAAAYQSWSVALSHEVKKRIAISDAAESN